MTGEPGAPVLRDMFRVNKPDPDTCGHDDVDVGDGWIYCNQCGSHLERADDGRLKVASDD